jgi:autotransporter translocation and assembly factor TamB
VNANWDNNVWYRDGLTKIKTQTNLELLKDHGTRDLRINGQVTLLRGSYDAYGRDFIIKSGDLNFTGEAEIDPHLNIQATHKMKDAVVDLDVTGTASKPELHFRSNPPMAEQDILAMLALGTVPGKSASQTGATDTTAQATELAADVVSDYLTRELRTTGMNVLDLDVIRVTPTDKGKEWTVGRYWGSKLFLSYSYNPENSASQVLKAEYAVTPKWFLVGQSGSQTDNYLDVNFRLPVGNRR